MTFYRKKSLVIEAWRVNDNPAPQWVLDSPRLKPLENGYEIKIEEFSNRIFGTILVGNGDWIVKGIRGELYPCSHEIFQETYEPVEKGI